MTTATQQGRPVRESRSEYIQVALPNDANILGHVLGGYIMLLVDLCGGLAAWRHARRPVVTASIDHMSFLCPVRVGQILILKSSVNRVFQSSMEVGVKVWVEDRNTGEVDHTSSAYLTFVALDENGKPTAVPSIIPESDDEMRRFEEAGRRREYRLLARQKTSLTRNEREPEHGNLSRV